MKEFDLIEHYFAKQTTHRDDVKIGIGDDAAVLIPNANKNLVITTDTLLENVHFPKETLPYDIGYKALAVNLSDLAAMGASPAYITMALTLPNENDDWIQSFCNGFFTLANRYNVQLIGGDLTRGPLSITITAMGYVTENLALLRSTAKPGDLIYVTGTLGDAGLALKSIKQHLALKAEYQREILERLHRPEPRITTGEALQGIASSCIDISDGLAADLTHILDESDTGAKINVNQLPLSEALTHSISAEDAIHFALTSGDDYELCFTVPKAKQNELEKKLATIACRYTCIGEMTKTKELDLHYQNGKKYHGPIDGYQHF